MYLDNFMRSAIYFNILVTTQNFDLFDAVYIYFHPIRNNTELKYYIPIDYTKFVCVKIKCYQSQNDITLSI